MARTRCCCRRTPPNLCRLGPWTVNSRGQRLTIKCNWDSIDPKSKSVVVVPSHYAFGHIQDLPQCTGDIAMSTEAQSESLSVANKRAHLPNLPTEILLQIFRPFIQTGQVFHFGPTSRGQRSLISVHRLLPEVIDPLYLRPYLVRSDNQRPAEPLITISTLAVICPRLHDVVYGIFYGGNQFVFELATQRLSSQVTCESAMVRSWNRLFAGTPEGLAPLSAGTATYLRSLTLSVALTSTDLPTIEWRQLRSWIQEIADLFAGTQHELHRLVVDVDVATHRQKRYLTDRLEVDACPNALHMKVKTTPSATAAKGISVRLMERLQQIVRPLECLTSVADLRLSGLLDKKFSPESAGQELQTAKRKHEGEGGDGKAPVKRRRPN